VKRSGVRALLVAAALSSFAAVAQTVPPPVVTLDGSRVDLAYPGKWVLLTYWATWCAPCIEEMPTLSRLAAARPDVTVLGVTDETIDPAALQAFVTRHRVAYPLAAVRAGSIAAYTGRVLGVGIRPLTYLIRPDGSLAKRFFGKITAAEVTAIVGSVRR